ncbi:nif11-like leader peptide domain protein [Synechococcus sp. BIOS-E4-1]|uniref:Nif11-like leader peptide family natural product precursor n=1 Tax=Synechococcus sp. BIOS-E4-1 TaxID=1400864 RepID=UPI00164500DC|nr:Nif11-like leader peptide family natural product precursor [Synechococcus sp. BIOS-E4-1]QNI54174.1 nif11-like leader peptide domain protein [Synechococcus sp. BIOS-E4-1]
MTQEQLTAFIANAKGNTSLQEQLKAAADVDTVIAITTEAGFSISADDLKKAQSEISDEELENAAGGWWESYECTCHNTSID